MRMLPKILGACAIAALAGSAAWAASRPVQHHLTVWLPGGGSEVITYTGDVAPKLSFTPGEFAPAPAAFWSPFDIGMPVDRIAAAMDNNMASMIRQADAMMAMPVLNGVMPANLGAMPPGSESYSVVSTMNGNNVCTQSVQITSSGNGHAPQVVRHLSGNCSASAATPDSSVLFQALPSRHDSHLMTIGTKTSISASAYPHI